LMFSDVACASPCPRFVPGEVDEDTGFTQCAKCGMWFDSDDPTMDQEEET
jgi:hypothetical protein